MKSSFRCKAIFYTATLDVDDQLPASFENLSIYPPKRNRRSISSSVLETLSRRKGPTESTLFTQASPPDSTSLLEVSSLFPSEPPTSVMFSRSIQQPNITSFSGKPSESVEDFLDEVHLAFTYIADAYTEQEDKESTPAPH